MFRVFMMLPLIVCFYEILSMILPLKISIPAKILCSLILLSGLLKTVLLRRGPSGFNIYELPYILNLILSGMFGFIIVAFFMLLAKDLVFIFWKLFIRSKFPSHYASLVVLILAAVSTIYGVYEAVKTPDVNIHEVKIKGLGREFDGTKIAMLVDIHASSINNRKHVESIVTRTNSLSPDIILMAGDFADGQVSSRYDDLEPLNRLRAPLGVYAVTGNHEYYYDLQGWRRELKNFGVRMLENEHVILTSGDSGLVIAGTPDPTGGNHNTALALNGAPENLPVILMDHQPRFAYENSKHNIALQVSGHTHGGQMPGIYTFVKRFNSGFVRGWYDIEGMKLYVSPGTSQWDGFTLRLFDPSEITLFILRSE